MVTRTTARIGLAGNCLGIVFWTVLYITEGRRIFLVLIGVSAFFALVGAADLLRRRDGRDYFNERADKHRHASVGASWPQDYPPSPWQPDLAEDAAAYREELARYGLAPKPRKRG